MFEKRKQNALILLAYTPPPLLRAFALTYFSFILRYLIIIIMQNFDILNLPDDDYDTL